MNTRRHHGHSALVAALAALLPALAALPQAAQAQSPETFDFTLSGFYDSSGSLTDTSVTGAFTGTPGADGLIEDGRNDGNDGNGRDDISAFQATVSGSGIATTTFTLGDLQDFRYGVDPSRGNRTVLFVYANDGADNVDVAGGVGLPTTFFNSLGEQQSEVGPDDGSNTETSYQNSAVTPAAAPEPSSVAAFGFAALGTAGLILKARKARRA